MDAQNRRSGVTGSITREDASQPANARPEPLQTLTVRIPMCPPYEVSPNATTRYTGEVVDGKRIKKGISRWEKSAAKTTYRHCAKLATVDAMNTHYLTHKMPTLVGLVDEAPISYRVVIGWEKGRKEADPDNAVACLKAAIDGIADALGINDKRMVMTDPVAQRRDEEGGGYTEFVIDA